MDLCANCADLYLNISIYHVHSNGIDNVDEDYSSYTYIGNKILKKYHYMLYVMNYYLLSENTIVSDKTNQKKHIKKKLFTYNKQKSPFDFR